MSGSPDAKKEDAANPATSPRAVLSAEIKRRLTLIADRLNNAEVPTGEELEALKRLRDLESTLPRPQASLLKKTGQWVLILSTFLMFSLAFVRLPSTRVDVEVRLNGLTVTMQPGGSDSLIAGERGEVLALKTARISGDTSRDFAFDVDPASIDSPRFEQMSIPAGKPCAAARRRIGTGSQAAVGSIPEKDTPCGPSTLRIELGFDKGARGIALEASGSQPATASLNTGTDFSPGSASGNKLRVELYPATGQKSIVVARNLAASGVTYELDGETSVLGGKIFVQSHLSQEIPIRSGDRLQIDTDEPAYVREMSLADGEIKADLSYLKATRVWLGNPAPLNLMPTVFDWIRARWPTQLYATITAIVAAWLAVKGWLEKEL